MSRENNIPNARHCSMKRGLAGVFSGIILVSSVLPASAQAGRSYRSAPAPRAMYSQRQPVRMAQNTVPRKPANGPAPRPQIRPQVRAQQMQPARPQAAQPPPVRPQTTAPASVPVRPIPQASAPTTPLVTPNRPGQTQQHLADWMEGHRNLPLVEQQRASSKMNRASAPLLRRSSSNFINGSRS